MYSSRFCKGLYSNTYSIRFFGEIVKACRVTSLIVIWKSRLHFAVIYSQDYKATIIADKLMKFEGYLLMAVLIKGCGKTRYMKNSCFF